MNPIVAIVLPVFAVMLTGYAATFTKGFGKEHTAALSTFVFNFAIPIMLVRTLVGSDLDTGFPAAYFTAYYGPVMVIYGAAYLLGRRFFAQDQAGAALLGMASTYGNSVLVGIPLVLMALGDGAALPLFLIISVHGLLLFTTTTLLLETGRELDRTRIIGRSIKGLAANPIFVSLILGVALNLADVQLYEAVDRWAGLIGQAAIPCALFAMGAALRHYRIERAIGAASLALVFKLVALPVLVFVLGNYLFDLPVIWLQTAVLLAALPTGVNVYLFANRYDAAIGMSATVILISTIISAVTLSAVLNMPMMIGG